jgi:hypothetical protein
MIRVQIASIPNREAQLKKTVESLRPQVDSLFVGLNNYSHAPDFLKDGEYGFFDNSMGDAVKFYNVENHKGYFFTCDDDLIYPKDYVKKMIKAIQKYGCIVTLHGKTYPKVITAFNKIMGNFRCLDDVFGDGRVDVGGTGVMAFHSDNFKISYSDFGSANMADVWLAKKAYEQKVKIMCLGHPKGYLLSQETPTTIWDTEKDKGFKGQTKLLKSFLK